MGFLPVFRKNQDYWLNQMQDLNSLQREVNRLFDFSLAKYPGSGLVDAEKFWFPAVDISDAKDRLVVTIDLPGLKREDIEISVEDDTLTIKGEKSAESERKSEQYLHVERTSGKFLRTIALPVEVDVEKVNAQLKDGVLELVLPKSEKSKPKQIKVDVK